MIVFLVRHQGSLFESMVDFPISVMVLLPARNASMLEILEWKINDEDMCPACGGNFQAVGLISDGSGTSAKQWPWLVSLWKRTNFQLLTSAVDQFSTRSGLFQQVNFS